MGRENVLVWGTRVFFGEDGLKFVVWVICFFNISICFIGAKMEARYTYVFSDTSFDVGPKGLGICFKAISNDFI